MKQSISDKEFTLLKDLIGQEFGLSFKTYTKEDLAKKLLPRLKKLRMMSFGEYYDYLTEDFSAKAELNALPASIMNTESYFLREFPQYRLFIELLQQLVESGKADLCKTVRILSAGCAFGQEPYSISMLLRTYKKALLGWKIHITAIDINPAALEKAQIGVYHSYSFRNSNSDFTKKYFAKTEKDYYRLDSDIIRSVDFKQANILDSASFRDSPALDFIFCRNVLIYMNLSAENRIARNFWEALSKGGYLFLGQSESFRRQTKLFNPVQFPDVTVYQKKLLP